jgi:hypothetical protein
VAGLQSCPVKPARQSAGPPSGRPCRGKHRLAPAPRETLFTSSWLCSATAQGTPFQPSDSARHKVLVRSM